MRERLESLIVELCSTMCAGRRTGTPGGLAARHLVREALAGAGVVPVEQPIPGIGGANLIARVEGSGPLADRTILVGAHYDHLGTGSQGEIYAGADDNAAAVAILVAVAHELVQDQGARRRILLVAFDAEEPPWFLGSTMGSEVLAASGIVPLETIDAMIALDLVGHAIGAPGLPSAVRDSVFVLGAESGEGLGGLVDARARLARGVHLRRVDADVIPPLSDYEAFRRRGVPFLFFTCGRSAQYHTPDDTPEKLDLQKIEALATALSSLVLDLAREAPRARFRRDAHDDRAMLATLRDLAEALEPFSLEARQAGALAGHLLAAATRRPLEAAERDIVRTALLRFESALA